MAEPQANGQEGLPLGPVTVAMRNLEGQLTRFRSGEITADEFKPARTILGYYGQRQPEKYMVRVRVPAGRLTSAQLRGLSSVARDYGNGTGHVTTRQNMQLHWLPLNEAPELLWRLVDVGLTGLQTGGNSVRTVAACPLAGACTREAFDVTPYAQAIDNRFLGDKTVMGLPRKIKTSLSGCAVDCSYTAIQDFGAIAEIRQGTDGQEHRGFRVFIGGGLGVLPQAAQQLEDFTPAEDLVLTCEAMLRVFDRLGERKNKTKARLKFLLRRLGIAEVRRLIQEEREKLRASSTSTAPVKTADNGAPDKPTPAPNADRQVVSAEYQRWLKWNVVKQRGGGGLYVVRVPLVLGDATSAQMDAVAAIADLFGDGEVRTTQHQNLVLRGIQEASLPATYRVLTNVGLTSVRAEGIGDVVSCPGATACSLAITSSKGLARELSAMLTSPAYQEDEALSGLRVKVSGCPDSCGQHYLADIGMYGCALHNSGRLYPAFQLVLAGEVTEEGTSLAQPVTKVPARRVPQALARLLEHYRTQRLPDERYAAYVDRMGLDTFRRLLRDLTVVPSPDEDPSFYVDWDATRMYVVERGEGECAV